MILVDEPSDASGTIVRLTAPAMVGFARLVAETVTRVGVETVAGALKSPPLFIVPQAAPLHPAPLTLQVTAVFDVPVTDASNSSVVPEGIEVSSGVTVTATTGMIVTIAEADFVGSATLVATTVALAGKGGTAGA